MSLPRYPEYKDSGVEWLGEVPAHWNLAKLKHLASFSGGGTPNRDNPEFWNGEIPWVSPKDMKAEIIQTAEECITDEGLAGSSTSLVPPGRVLMVVRSGILKHTIPVAINAVEVALNQDMKALAFKNPVTSMFFQRWVQGLNDDLLLAWSKQGATVESIEHAYLAETVVPLPPEAEQTVIAAFLDHETDKIDALITEQEKLITLLAEKRQATISRAVTRGLNPDAPMKDSGVAWLGEVPVKWEIRTVAKATTKITNGYVGPTRDILIEDGLPYVQATHIKNGRVNFGQDYFVSEEWSNAHAKSILEEGDVLIVQTGAGTGNVGLVSSNEAGFNCHALIILSSDKSILHGSYLAAILQSTYGRAKLTSIQTGAMHPHLNCGEVKFVEIPLPPLTEQIDIMAFLDSETARLDALSLEATSAIDLLKERRTALISAAVTGKIDVRNA